VLAATVLLQIGALVARSEAWHLTIRAAGGSRSRGVDDRDGHARRAVLRGLGRRRQLWLRSRQGVRRRARSPGGSAELRSKLSSRAGLE
jgi:hypothetical protein